MRWFLIQSGQRLISLVADVDEFRTDIYYTGSNHRYKLEMKTNKQR